MSDSFSAFSDQEQVEDFLPTSTEEAVYTASASHRIAPNIAAGLSLTSVDGDLYPEASVQAYYGSGRGFLSIATGPDGQYGAVAGGSVHVGPVNTSVDLRVVKSAPLPTDPLDRFSRYRPFLRDERSINAIVQSAFWDGQVSLRAAYGEFSETSDRYFVGVSYTQPASIDWLGSGLARFEASVSDADARVGFRFTLTEKLDAQSIRSATLGGEYVEARAGVRDSTSSGLFPVAQVGYTRDFDLDDTRLTASALAGAGDGELSAQAALRADSNLGEADMSVGVAKPHSQSTADLYLTGNMRTGFVYGDGLFHFGGVGFGDAAVLVEIDEAGARGAHDGRFRVVVDGLPQESLRVGQRAAISLPAFTQPRIALSPEAAPPFDIDLSAREAPLYPGNVVFMSWSAIRVVTAYGRLLDQDGRPQEGVFIGAGNDIAVTGEGGYFSVTAPVGSRLSVRDRGISRCNDLASLPEPKSDSRRAVVNLGPLVCARPDVGAGSAEPEASLRSASVTADADQASVVARQLARGLFARQEPDPAAATVVVAKTWDVVARQVQAGLFKPAKPDPVAGNITAEQSGALARLIANALLKRGDH
jgi:hypothetical protein